MPRSSRPRSRKAPRTAAAGLRGALLALGLLRSPRGKCREGYRFKTLIRELTEAALVLRGERVTRFNSETASVLPAPAVGAWRFLLLRGTAALDSRLLLPLLRPTASGGLRLLLLRRAAALDPWLLQLSGSPALHSRLRLLLLLLIGPCWSLAGRR